MIGPHWPMYLFFCGGVTTGYIIFFLKFFIELHLVTQILGIFSFFLFFLSYTGTFILNPGYKTNKGIEVGMTENDLIYAYGPIYGESDRSFDLWKNSGCMPKRYSERR